VAKRGAARFPRAIIRTLKATLNLRDKRDEYSAHGFAVWRGRLESQLDRYLAWEPRYLLNAKFVKHLRRERPHLLTFLYHPEVDATNWRAEQAIRPAVVTRKMSGGNRTVRGARAQAVLTTVIRTCTQQGVDAWASLVRLLRGESGDLKLLPEPG
jgi:transposase